MNKKIVIIVLAALLCCIATQVSAGTSGAKPLRWYLEAGGGTAAIEGDLLPTGSLHTGIQLGPSVAVGAYSTLTLLSDFEHAEFGLSTADVEAAFSLATGTELTFTPFPERRLHPLVRLSVGGITTGYLENTDGEEGYETAHVQRFSMPQHMSEVNLPLPAHSGSPYKADGRSPEIPRPWESVQENWEDSR